MRFFEAKASREAEILAEALGLVDDGLEPDFVASLYAGDGEWLLPLLGDSNALREAYEAEPSYFFEASLKERVLAAARDRAGERQPAGLLGTFRTAAAGMTVLAAAAFFGVVTLGFVTASQSVPGDWNYAFKLATEQFRYTTSRGDQRIELQIDFTSERVAEITRKLESGRAVSPEDIAKVEREASQLVLQINKSPELEDEALLKKLTELGEQTSVTLRAAQDRSVDLEPKVTSAIGIVNDAIAAGTGGTGSLPEPAVTPTATPAATASPTPTGTATPEPTGTPEPTTTPEPATPTPEPTATAGPAATPGPSPDAEPTATGNAEAAPE